MLDLKKRKEKSGIKGNGGSESGEKGRKTARMKEEKEDENDNALDDDPAYYEDGDAKLKGR